jgi:hypothetical protein
MACFFISNNYLSGAFADIAIGLFLNNHLKGRAPVEEPGRAVLGFG